MGPKIHQKSIKNGVEKTTGKKTGKYVPFANLGRSIGGLAVVTGEVRRGSPSGYGRIPVTSVRIPIRVQNHASTPVGYGEFKSLREIAVPQRNPGEEVPETNGVSRSSRQNPALAGGARALAKFLLGLARLK